MSEKELNLTHLVQPIQSSYLAKNEAAASAELEPALLVLPAGLWYWIIFECTPPPCTAAIAAPRWCCGDPWWCLGRGNMVGRGGLEIPHGSGLQTSIGSGVPPGPGPGTGPQRPATIGIALGWCIWNQCNTENVSLLVWCSNRTNILNAILKHKIVHESSTFVY